MTLEIFDDPVVVRLGPLPVSESAITAGCTSLLLLGLTAFAAAAVRRQPGSRVAAAARIFHGFIHDLVVQAAGRSTPFLETLAGTIFLFVAGCTVVGQLPGVTAPTAKLPVTAALAVAVFVSVPAFGIRARGLRSYLRDYFRPNPLLFPLHVVSELSRTLALALRLFGNMMSGHLLVGILVALVGLFVPVPLMALDLLIGFLQAYIFTILACVYIGAAVRAEGQS